MKLTPLDIRHKEFKRGMRGYADVEVDEFLDQIADEYERLFKENIDLQERVEALEDKVAGYRRIEETLQKTLVNAQANAEEQKQNANKQAQLVLQDAELKARQLVNEAYSERQAIEQSMAKLRNAEEDFRFKFGQLLTSANSRSPRGRRSRRRRPTSRGTPRRSRRPSRASRRPSSRTTPRRPHPPQMHDRQTGAPPRGSPTSTRRSPTPTSQVLRTSPRRLSSRRAAGAASRQGRAGTRMTTLRPPRRPLRPSPTRRKRTPERAASGSSSARVTTCLPTLTPG